MLYLKALEKLKYADFSTRCAPVRRVFFSVINCADIVTTAMKSILRMLRRSQLRKMRFGVGTPKYTPAFGVIIIFFLNEVHKIQMFNVNDAFVIATCGYLLCSHLQAFFCVSFLQVSHISRLQMGF